MPASLANTLAATLTIPASLLIAVTPTRPVSPIAWLPVAIFLFGIGNAPAIFMVVVALFVYSFVGRPALPLLIASRIILIPLVAAIAYEMIRFAAKHMDKGWVRVLMKPGLALQKLTTREPTLDQLEVAIASLRAVMTAEQLAEVEARPKSTAPAKRSSRPTFSPA